MSVAAMRSLGADGHAKSADGRFCQGARPVTHIQELLVLSFVAIA